MKIGVQIDGEHKLDLDAVLTSDSKLKFKFPLDIPCFDLDGFSLYGSDFPIEPILIKPGYQITIDLSEAPDTLGKIRDKA